MTPTANAAHSSAHTSLLGKFEVRRIRLGAAGVLFSGLLFAHFGAKVDHHVLHFVREFGLILFVYTSASTSGRVFCTPSAATD